MNRVAASLLRLMDRVSPPEVVSAHCDIPCGIYDPYAAQIGALTVIRMNQLVRDLPPMGADASKEQRDSRVNSVARYVAVKESHAEIVKRELDILWHDYFKPEHIEKHPDLHTMFWNANKLASKNKQELNLKAAEDLLAAVHKVAEVFWETKGVKTRRQSSYQTVGGELVVPAS